MESFAHACGNRRRSNERFAAERRKIGDSISAGLLEHRSVGIDRAGGDAVNRLDVSPAGYVYVDFVACAQTSAGSTIVASCSAKTGLLKYRSPVSHPNVTIVLPRTPDAPRRIGPPKRSRRPKCRRACPLRVQAGVPLR